MTPATEKQLWEFVGEVRESLKNINEKFDSLPCTSQSKRIDELEDYKNQMIGKVSIISVVCGAIGYGISVGINWFLNK